MKVSVIIPTLNRDSFLNQCLISLANQDFPVDQYEVLVLDNGSTDRTQQITENIIQQNPNHNIRYICEPEPGLLSGRHCGALEAKGEICIFVDDDIEADPDWLNAISESFQDPSVQLVGGRNLPKYEVPPPSWLEWFWQTHKFGKLLGELSLLDLGEEVREIDATFIWGLNFSIRRQALFDLGGFHPDCIAKHLQHFQGDGETGLTIKANETGYKAIYQPQALVWHQVPESRMTYKYFEQRYFYQGVSNSYTEIRNLGSLPKTNYMQSVKELIKTPFRAIKQLIRNTDNTNTEEKVLKTKLHQSFINGVNFHRTAIRQNPQLLEWVMKKDYWDYKLPKY